MNVGGAKEGQLKIHSNENGDFGVFNIFLLRFSHDGGHKKILFSNQNPLIHGGRVNG